MNRIPPSFICLSVFLVLSCTATTRQYRAPGESGKWTQIEITAKSLPEAVNPVKTRIYTPKHSGHGIPRVLVALHDYNGGSFDWASRTGITGYADQYGIVLVCPEMGSTIYETRYYPETVKKWNTVPGGKWIAEILLPHLRGAYGLALDRSRTGIAGIGTGARGALLVAASYPALFSFAAGLSGYYETSILTGHSLLKPVYGLHKEFPERWKNDDNIIALAENLKDTRVFLAHGGRDTEIPVEHSRILGLKLRFLQKRYAGKYHFEYVEVSHRTHDWRFWSSVTADMIKYFTADPEK